MRFAADRMIEPDDVDHLEGWGKRVAGLEKLLGRGREPSHIDHWMYRPCRTSGPVLMMLEVKFPAAVALIKEALDWAELARADYFERESPAEADAYEEAVTALRDRIETAVAMMRRQAADVLPEGPIGGRPGFLRIDGREIDVGMTGWDLLRVLWPAVNPVPYYTIWEDALSGDGEVKEGTVKSAVHRLKQSLRGTRLTVATKARNVHLAGR